MIDEKRVKEAQKNVARYLKEGLLKKDTNETAKFMYIDNSNLSIKTAEKLLSLEGEDYKPYLWVTVISYYSMYYIANAVLLELGYKVGDKISHKVTSDSLMVFVRNKLTKELIEEYEAVKQDALEITSTKADEILRDFDRELDKRSRFQYEMSETVKRSNALTSLERAKRFVFEMDKLVRYRRNK